MDYTYKNFYVLIVTGESFGEKLFSIFKIEIMKDLETSVDEVTAGTAKNVLA